MIASRPFAMGRPRRPSTEAQLVVMAARQHAAGRSARAAASIVAMLVVADAAVALALPADDEFACALADARRKMNPTPVAELANLGPFDVSAELVERRIDRLRGRFGRDLSPHGRKMEDAAIMRDVAEKLAGRYVRALRAEKFGRCA